MNAQEAIKALKEPVLIEDRFPMAGPQTRVEGFHAHKIREVSTVIQELAAGLSFKSSQLAGSVAENVARERAEEVQRTKIRILESELAGHKAEIDRLSAKLAAEDLGWKRIAEETHKKLEESGRENARLRAERSGLTPDQEKTIDNLKTMMCAGARQRRIVEAEFYPQACRDVIEALDALRDQGKAFP